MTIKHLLDHRARLPRLGRIRLGVKKVAASGKEYPAEVAYFVIPDELKAVLGEQPKLIPVLFPVDDVERVLVADYTVYGRGQTGGPGMLLRRCDGEEFREWPRQGGEVTGRCKKVDPFRPCPDGCRAVGVLNVIVFDGPVGVFQVTVGGEQRLADLAMELGMFRSAFGRLTNIVFDLVREETTVNVRKESGERLAKIGWPVHVRCRSVSARVALQASGQKVLALPSGPTEEAEGDAVPEDEDLPAGNGAAPKEAGGDNQAPPAGRPAIGPGAESTAGPLFSQAGSSEGERVALTHEVGGSSPPPPEPWDISMAYRAAAQCGIGADLYGRWLVVRYGKDADNVTATDIAAEEAAFGALKTAGEQLARKAEVVKAVNEALRRREGTPR